MDVSEPPALCSGSGGLVSTVDDCLAFHRMLRSGGGEVLSPASVRLMTTPQLTQEQVDSAPIFFGGNSSWGFGLSIVTHRDNLWMSPGRYGWVGGYGTSAYVDPSTGLIGVFLSQRHSPEAPPVFEDFWTQAYQALS